MNLFVNIPVPAANGSGAAVDVSGIGATKTISVAGPFDAAVTIEYTNEAAPTSWAPLVTFNNPDGGTFDFVAHWIRATVRGYKSGTPQCDLGGSDLGAAFASLPVTVGNGAGAAVDVSGLGTFKTVTVGGAYRGNVQIEISEDGITAWSQIGLGFPTPGAQSQSVIAHWMRAVRSGVPQIDPGLPVVDVGATVDVAPPPPSSDQVFRYVVTGMESNPFTVALPTVRSSASYNVQCTFGGPIANAFKEYRPLASTFLTTGFDVECGAVPDAGDVLMFTVENLT